MPPEKSEEVRAWLHKARHDLLAAARLLEGEAPLADVAVYHCQQAGEKALKAYLTANDHLFGKTHSLVELTLAAAETDPSFLALRQQAESLTPFVSRFRYPGVSIDPDLDEAHSALRMAAEVLEFVTARISGLSP
jgi:HEPN domain-containing protein